MPQGDIKNLNFRKPLEIKALQYDIVCDGEEFLGVQKFMSRINVQVV